MSNKITEEQIALRGEISKLIMALKGVEKSMSGYNGNYRYQNFNEILKEIKTIIKEQALDLGFNQKPTFRIVGNVPVDVIETTFYSNTTEASISFDTRIFTSNLESVPQSKMMSLPQMVGSAITYFKRYALVSFLNIESELDDDAQTPEEIQASPIIDNNETRKKNILYLIALTKRIITKIEESPFGTDTDIDQLKTHVLAKGGQYFIDFCKAKKVNTTMEYWEDLIKKYIKIASDSTMVIKFNHYILENKSKFQNKVTTMCGFICQEFDFFKDIVI